ncbi:MAG: multicopper oxidase family protein [Betaproteobacteria bacterium]
MDPISRRRFLRAAGALLLPVPDAALQAALDPEQAVPSLPELSLDRREPGLAQGQLVAEARPVRINGRTVEAWTYNGSYPGPLIRVREGETLRLTLVNRLPVATNLHFHGMWVSPSGRGDNVWVQVPPGESFTYEFAIPAGNAGLQWYHPHIHGASAEPLFRGLAGALLVEGEEAFERELVCDDRVLVLKDLTVEGGRIPRVRPTEVSAGREGQWLLVNGMEQPVLQATRTLLRARFLNASNSRYWKLRLSNEAPMTVIALDGRTLESPRELQELLLVPGARAEALIVLDNPAPVDLWYHPVPRREMQFTGARPLLRILPPPAATPVRIPGRLARVPRFGAAPPDSERDIVLGLFNLCGRFLNPARVDIRTRVGAREIWNVRNADYMDHAFHLHTWHYELLDFDGRAPAHLERRDVHNVRIGENMRIGIHFTGHSGRTLYHCHFAEHADAGMMAVLQVDP